MYIEKLVLLMCIVLRVRLCFMRIVHAMDTVHLYVGDEKKKKPTRASRLRYAIVD
jgi:fumarate reductase subunit D